MKQYVDWYAQFGMHDIVVPVDEGTYIQSSEYIEHFKTGSIQHLFRMRRYVNQTRKEVFNVSMDEFCKKIGRKRPNAYRKAFMNSQAAFMNVAKYDREQPEGMDEKAWSLSGEWTKDEFQCMNGSKVLPLQTCLDDCNKSSSCGYPWNRRWHSKQEMFDDDIIESICNSYWDNIAKFDVSEHMVPIFNSSQKVELRDVDKLRENKLRTFTAAPVEHSINLNRFCLEQNNKFYDSHNKTWSFVGCTKYLGEWDALYRRLGRFGDPRHKEFIKNAFELDESAFDCSLFRKAMYGQRDIRWSMLDPDERTPENWQRFVALYDAMVESVIILETGEVIRKSTGNPSGSANTIVDNTMILFRLLCYAWIVLCRKQGRPTTYLDMKREVEAVLNGDDNTFTCSDAVVDWFNATSVSEIWSGLGIKTTSPCYKPQHLSKVHFLSQGFKWDDNIKKFLPEPDTEKVLSSLMWGSEIDDIRWHLLRAHALRCDSYGNQELRVIIQRYINFVNEKYANQLVGVCNDIPVSEIKGIWRSDRALDAAYSGLECGPNVTFIDIPVNDWVSIPAA
jgi:hypothetical protein